MSTEMQNLAACAEAARDALIALAAAVRKVPGAKVNLSRSVELLSDLASRAARSSPSSTTGEVEQLSRTLAAALATLQGDGSPLARDKADEIEKQFRRALARENGARGGRKMTDKKREALSQLHKRRRENVGNAPKSSAPDSMKKVTGVNGSGMAGDERINSIPAPIPS